MLQVGNPYCLEGAVSKDYDKNFAKETTDSDLPELDKYLIGNPDLLFLMTASKI